MKKLLHVFLFAVLAAVGVAAPVQYFVKPATAGGSDAANGLTYATAKATLAGAQTAVRARIASGYPQDGIEVLIDSAGEYALTSSLLFTPADSGTAAAPVVWKGYGAGKPVIHAGQKIPYASFAAVSSGDSGWSRLDSTERTNTKVVSLPSLTPAISSYGTIQNTMVGHSAANIAVAPLELFVDGTRQVLAEYNSGNPSVLYCSAFPSGNATISATDATNVSTLFGTWSNWTEVVMSGFRIAEYQWNWDKAQSRSGATITFTGGSVSGSTNSNISRVKFSNILEEISDGEYFVDRTDGKLYVDFAGTPTADTEIWVSLGTFDLISFASGTSNIRLEGLELGYGRGNAVNISGAAYQATTISASSTDNSINDSASSFPLLVAGDSITISGFTGNAGNNATATVVSRTSSKIVLSGVTLVTDAAGERVYFETTAPADGIELVGNEIHCFGLEGILGGRNDGNDNWQNPNLCVSKNIRISANWIHDLGGSAIILNSGKRTTLESGKSVIRSNTIERVAQRFYSGRPGIMLSGVGTRCVYNLITDAAGIGAFVRGNNHYFAFNELSHCSKFFSDYATIYTSNRSWVDRGTVFEYNLLHSNVTSHPVGAVHAFYGDDCASDVTIRRNIVWDAQDTAFYFTGGRDKKVYENVIGTVEWVHNDDNRGIWRISGTYSPPTLTNSYAVGDDWNLLEKALKATGTIAVTDQLYYNTTTGISPTSVWGKAYPALCTMPATWTPLTSSSDYYLHEWFQPEGTVFEYNTYATASNGVLRDNPYTSITVGGSPVSDEYTNIAQFFVTNRSNTVASMASYGLTQAMMDDRTLRPEKIVGPRGVIIPIGRIGPLKGDNGSATPIFTYVDANGDTVSSSIAPFSNN